MFWLDILGGVCAKLEVTQMSLHSCTPIFSFVCRRAHLTAKQLLKVQSTKLQLYKVSVKNDWCFR